MYGKKLDGVEKISDSKTLVRATPFSKADVRKIDRQELIAGNKQIFQDEKQQAMEEAVQRAFDDSDKNEDGDEEI